MADKSSSSKKTSSSQITLGTTAPKSVIVSQVLNTGIAGGGGYENESILVQATV